MKNELTGAQPPWLRCLFAVALLSSIVASGCAKPGVSPVADTPNPSDARSIAKEAYLYAFPMAANYETLYKQAITLRVPITARLSTL